MKVTIIIVRKGYFCPDKAILSGIYPSATLTKQYLYGFGWLLLDFLQQKYNKKVR